MQRNALGVVYDKRAGATRCWRAQWGTTEGPVDFIQRLVGHHDSGLLPGRFAYEVESLIASMPGRDEVDARWLRDALAGELRRLAARKLSRTKGGTTSTGGVRRGLELGEIAFPELNGTYRELHDAITHWVQAALLARLVAQCQRPIDRIKGTPVQAGENQ